jgi:hypothetical protein
VETWEKLLLGALGLLIIFLFRPGIKAALEQSRQAEKDWPAVLVPLGVVIVFVIFLISVI